MTHFEKSFPDMSHKFVDDGRIEMLHTVGRGGWGVVYRAREIVNGKAEDIAVKVIVKPSKNSSRASYLRREIDHHRRMSSHPHVVTLRRVFSDACFLYIVLDYIPGGDMWRAIQDRAIYARNDDLVRSVFMQLIDVVEACHKEGIYHRDIKPSNILVSPDGTQVYLADFGLSTAERVSAKFHVGTASYESPGK